MLVILFSIIIILLAFIMGALPLSVWIAQVARNVDIRQYGDGNPGATNVFRAGLVGWGIVAVFADIFKGIPPIVIGNYIIGLPQPILYMTGVAAVLGHAYSPFLGFRGGKALAVFGGTLIALMRWDIIAVLAALFIVGALFFVNDAWTVLIGMFGLLVYLLLLKSDIMAFIFIGVITFVFILKQRHSLKTVQFPSGRLVGWIKSRRRMA